MRETSCSPRARRALGVFGLGVLGLLALSAAPRPTASEGRAPAGLPGDAGKAPAVLGARRVTCVLIVRHAEKESDAADAALSDVGRKRAERLAETVSKAPVTALIASDRLRTRRTLEPIAREKKVPVERISEPKAVAERIRKLPAGSIAVVAHHSDTIPEILTELGLESPKDLFVGNDFSNLLCVMVPPAGAPELLHLRY